MLPAARFLPFFFLPVCFLAGAQRANAESYVESLNKASKAMVGRDFLQVLKCTALGLQAAPHEANLLFLRARAFHELHRPQEALTVYEQLLKEKPDARYISSSYQDMAVCCADLQRLPAAQKYLDQAIALSPSAYAFKLKGQIFRLQDDEAKALVYLKKAVEMDPKDYWGIRELTYCYTAQKNYPEALKESCRLVKLRPGEPDSYAIRAKIYEKLGQTAQAKKDFDMARSKTDFPF